MNPNALFGKTIIDQLIKQGVTYFVHAPGKRSTPIVKAIAEDPRAEVFVHFDERGAAYHALGYAKATKKPAAVVVTSGTAVGNLMPAVMEAAMSHTPLILLTCDRPHELRDTGANQTCDQTKIFGDFVRYHFDFPRPSAEIPLRFLAATLAQGVLQSKFPLPGPIQLNLPFFEPFFDEGPIESNEMEKVAFTLPKSTCDKQIDLSGKKGVIVLGAGGSSKEVTQLAKKLNWPIFADIVSGHRELADPQSISHYHHLLKALPDLRADVIVHVGGAVVSKVVQNWIKAHDEVIYVSPYTSRFDPDHLISHRLFSCEAIEGEPIEGWHTLWKSLEEGIHFDLGALTEPSIISSLVNRQTALFFANSMPIRDADMFFFPEGPRAPLFANRGLSGIDGNIATLCGIASQMPITAVLGDQSVLHDLNSLAQIRKTKHPVTLIILNNGGGGIFSFVSQSIGKELLDPYFAAAHDLSFASIVEGFGLTYKKVEKIEEIQTSGAQVLEVVTHREENFQLHQQIDREICSFFSTVS